MQLHSRWFGFFAVTPLIISLISLGGWWIDHHALAAAIPGYTGMTFNTALCFVLLSSGLLIGRVFPAGNQLARHARLGLASFVTVFAVLTLMQNIIGVDFGLDGLFFDSTPYYPDNPYPGRMSPQTLIAFTFSGIALFLLSCSSIRAPLTINGGIIGSKFLGIFGVAMAALFPVKPVGLAYLSSMSLFTAIAFVFASLALRALFQSCDKHTEREQQAFFPCIRLMFRLTYPRKFVLIGLVFALPLGMSTWYAVSSSNKEMSTLYKEVAGLNISKETITLFSMVQRHRGMMNAFMQDGKTFKRALPEQEAAINEQIQLIAIATTSLDLFPRKQWLEIISAWQKVRDRNEIADIASCWKKHTKLIEMIMRFTQQVGQSSTLLYDLEPAVNNLASIMLLDMPQLFEAVGVLRGQATGFLADGKFTDEERFAMGALDGHMDVRYESTVESIDALKKQDNPHFHALINHLDDKFAPLMERIDEVTDAIKDSDQEQLALMGYIGDKFASSMEQKRAKGYFLVATDALNSGFDLHAMVVESLQHIMNERINEHMKARYMLASVVMIALLLILYLFAAFYKSVMLTIEALEDKAHQMQQGDFSSALALDNCDEMGHVVDSFNLVAEELVSAVDKAKEATIAKSRFLAMMSHEIRTPLNGVLGLTELVLDSNLSKDQREQLQTVHASGEILLIILNDILDFSKMEAGQFELSVAPFSPNELIEHVIKLYAQNAHNKGVELIGDAIPDLDCHLIGDSDRLQQVLMNLVSNAVKFTAVGEVSLRVSVLAEDDDKMALRFAVHDSGIGISKEDQHKLFSDFSQVDASHGRQYGGTGLGLSIALKLMRLMDSKIHVESEEGKGSNFFFDVEMKKGEKLPDAAIFHQQDFSKWRVLIVGNDGHQRTMLGDLLTGWGMRVNAENSMPAALDALMNAVEEDAYHVVMIDKMASEINALELIRSIRQKEKLSGLKIIIQCAHDEVRSNRKNEDEGVNAFLRKPLYQSSLYKQILRVMGSMQYGSSVELPQETFADARAERILLAEDVIVNQQVACGMLKKLGFGHVDIANNGVEAVEMFAKESYALVFMDIQMPEMDGHTAARKIRESMQGKQQDIHVPIIALTAHAFSDDHQESLDSGINDHITKPLTGAKLAEVMNRWLPDVGEDADIETEEQQHDDLQEHASQDNKAEATAPGVHADVLRRLYQDMGGMGIGAIIDAYAGGLPDQLEKLCAAIDEQDAGAVCSIAHRLKGSSRSMGAEVLGNIVFELEKMGSEGNVSAAKAMKDALCGEVEIVQQALNESWLDEIR